VRQLRDRPGAIVFATSRNPDSAKLKALTDKGNVHLVKITKQPEAVDEALQAAELVRKVAGKVDVVIANAGEFGPWPFSLYAFDSLPRYALQYDGYL
jgi:NAD(P)-dependent dehydrogenase (short-subunit alcohol dehydrogenase family)